MDRTVPVAHSEEIELYIRTYYSLLRSSGPIRVRRDSPPSQRQTLMLTLISANRSANLGERGERKARAGGAFCRP